MASPFLHIIEQHAEEAAFLWLLHSQEAQSPNQHHNHLAQLEKRINAHVKGLIMASDDGWNCCTQALETYGEAGEVFTATMLALHSSNKEHFETMLQAVESAPETAQAMISALGWRSFEAAKPIADQLLDAESPIRKKFGLATYVIHQKSPNRLLDGNIGKGDMLWR